MTTGTVNSPTSFSKAVLAAGGWPQTQSNINFLNSWQASEGQWGASGAYNAANQHNPLNIESNIPGSPNGTALPVVNGATTLSYPSWGDGVTATVNFLNQSNYTAIQSALTSGNAGQANSSGALAGALSSWSGGSYTMVGGTPTVNSSAAQLTGSASSATASGAGASSSSSSSVLGQCSSSKNLINFPSLGPIGGGGFLNQCNAKAILSGSLVVFGGVTMLIGVALLFAGGHGVAGKVAEVAGAGVALVPGGEAAGGALLKAGHSESLRSKNKHQAAKAQARGGPRDTLKQRRDRQSAETAKAQAKGAASSTAARNKHMRQMSKAQPARSRSRSYEGRHPSEPASEDTF